MFEKPTLCFLILTYLAIATIGCPPLLLSQKLRNYSANLPATDALGRKLPENKDVGDPRKDKFVGLFYWTWHTQPGKNTPHITPPESLPKNQMRLMIIMTPFGLSLVPLFSGQSLCLATTLTRIPGCYVSMPRCWLMQV